MQCQICVHCFYLYIGLVSFSAIIKYKYFIDNQEYLEEVEDQFLKEMDDEAKTSNVVKKRIIKPKRLFGSFASEHEVAVATGKKRCLPLKLHKEKQNGMKDARENTKCRDRAQVASDKLLAQKKSKDLTDDKITDSSIKKLKTTEVRRKMFISEAISQSDSLDQLNDSNESNEDDSISEISAVLEDGSHDETLEDTYVDHRCDSRDSAPKETNNNGEIAITKKNNATSFLEQCHGKSDDFLSLNAF